MAEEPFTTCLDRNPYVGPRPFRRGEAFYGRESDARGLTDMLISSRIVLLHSPSGAGKTSLIQAAIMPFFDARNFQVCAQQEPQFSALRVNWPPPEFPVRNRYVYSTVLGLAGWLVASPNDLAETSLVDALAMVKDESRQHQLLVFDQLEEVLTLDPTDLEGQREFFNQVGEALDDAGRWALLSMREDYMGGLDRFLKQIPGRLRATYRLNLLDERSAVEAIRQPARGCDVEVDEGGAQKLVDDLRTVKVEAVNGSSTLRKGPYVEPVLLQVVCHRLWRKLCRDHRGGFTRVDAADLEHIKQVNAALRRYYADVVAEASSGDRSTERVLRDWIGDKLITKEGFRSPARWDLPLSDRDAARNLLRDRYLIRPDERVGATWWELSHDRLIGPVLQDNAAWRSRNLEPWQVAAAIWHDRQDDSFLLRGDDYLRARRSLARQQDAATETERRFVERSGLRQAEEHEREGVALQVNLLAVRVNLFALLLVLSVALNIVFILWLVRRR